MIYAIRTNKMRNGFIKIGYSSNPLKRIPSLRTACPYEFELIYLGVGEKKGEASLHEKFKHHSRKGEWFTDCEEIREYFGYKFMNSHEFKATPYWRSIEMYFHSHKKNIFSLKAACLLWGLSELTNRENKKNFNFEILNVDISSVKNNYEIIGPSKTDNDYIVLPLPDMRTALEQGVPHIHNCLFPLVEPSRVFENKYGTIFI